MKRLPGTAARFVNGRADFFEPLAGLAEDILLVLRDDTMLTSGSDCWAGFSHPGSILRFPAPKQWRVCLHGHCWKFQHAGISSLSNPSRSLFQNPR
jgi:hypothetical protein